MKKPLKIPARALFNAGAPEAQRIAAQALTREIFEALMAVNGRADSHTYTFGIEISNVADDAEKALSILPKALRAGATYVAVSGGSVSRAYCKKGRYRKATRVTLVRNSSGWVLTDIASEDIAEKAPSPTLTLTETQDAEAVARFRSQYRVAKALQA